MFKTCARCGTIHDINVDCYKNKNFKKSNTKADYFRKTYKWQKKAEQIKSRDKYLCKICMFNLYNTVHKYNFNKLEVHHINKVNEDYNSRLDDENLITLCCYHHKLADDNIIQKELLKELACEVVDNNKVEEIIKKIAPLLEM